MTCVLGTGSFQWAVLPFPLCPFYHLFSISEAAGTHLIVLCLSASCLSYHILSVQSLLSALCFLSYTGAPCYIQSKSIQCLHLHYNTTFRPIKVRPDVSVTV